MNVFVIFGFVGFIVFFFVVILLYICKKRFGVEL